MKIFLFRNKTKYVTGAILKFLSWNVCLFWGLIYLRDECWPVCFGGASISNIAVFFLWKSHVLVFNFLPHNASCLFFAGNGYMMETITFWLWQTRVRHQLCYSPALWYSANYLTSVTFNFFNYRTEIIMIILSLQFWSEDYREVLEYNRE